MKVRFVVTVLAVMILTLFWGHYLADGVPEVAAAESSSKLCVYLFDDLNGDGKRESKEELVSLVSAKFHWTKDSNRDIQTGMCVEQLSPGTFTVSIPVDDSFKMTTFSSVTVTLTEGKTGVVWFGRQKKSATSSLQVTNIYLDPRLTFEAIDSVASKKGDSRFTSYVKALVYSESGGMHYNSSGSVKIGRNSSTSYDRGLFQLNNIYNPGLSDADAADPEKNLYYGMEVAWSGWIVEGRNPLNAAWKYKGKTQQKLEYAQRVVNYMKNPPKGADGKPFW